MFSVMRVPCRVYVGKPNSEAKSCESQEDGNTTAYSGVQRSVQELKFSEWS
jgi:hypothetical protein